VPILLDLLERGSTRRSRARRCSTTWSRTRDVTLEDVEKRFGREVAAWSRA
jgi:hypothetical protein